MHHLPKIMLLNIPNFNQKWIKSKQKLVQRIKQRMCLIFWSKTKIKVRIQGGIQVRIVGCRIKLQMDKIKEIIWVHSLKCKKQGLQQNQHWIQVKIKTKQELHKTKISYQMFYNSQNSRYKGYRRKDLEVLKNYDTN